MNISYVLSGLCCSESNRELTEFEKYLQNQAELEKRKKKTGGMRKNKMVKPHAIEEEVDGEINGETDQRKGTKKKSPLKKSILLPKKRPKKEKIGTHSSNNWWQVLSVFILINWKSKGCW
jgi:hypothetical protein